MSVQNSDNRCKCWRCKSGNPEPYNGMWIYAYCCCLGGWAGGGAWLIPEILWDLESWKMRKKLHKLWTNSYRVVRAQWEHADLLPFLPWCLWSMIFPLFPSLARESVTSPGRLCLCLSRTKWKMGSFSAAQVVQLYSLIVSCPKFVSLVRGNIGSGWAHCLPKGHWS